MNTNSFNLFAHISIALPNFRNLVCTIFYVNVVWYTLARVEEISYICLKEHNKCEKVAIEKSAMAEHFWTNDHNIK